MTKNNLPYPFNVAFDEGHSIDYKCAGGEDHRYVGKLGYESEMASDCTYFARGLNGLSLSSYGDWGTLHGSFSDEKSNQIFLEMYEMGIIKLWRITAYIRQFLPHINGWIVDSYEYEEGRGWRTYSEAEGKWVECEDPFKEKEAKL